MTTPLIATRCASCSAEIAPGLLACPGCKRLVHAAELTKLASAAETAERQGDLTTALGSWRRATELLPPQTVQLATILERMDGLSARIDGRDGNGGKKAGAAAGVGAVGLAIVKSKALIALLLGNGKLLLLGLFKLPTLVSMLFYASWTTGRGVGFGVGLVASIYVHEVGHVAALKRYGIEASAPMFVPGFGAFVRMKQYPTNAHEEARTGLAGPLWGLVAALVAAAIGILSGSHIALSVASLGATINLFNLIPVWQLDGARGLKALARNERLLLAVVGVATGLMAHQWLPAVIGLLVFSRSFSGAHAIGDRRVLLLFATLIVAHACVATFPLGERIF